MNIAVAGTGYVGLSLAVLLAQHNSVKAMDIVPAKVELINRRKSPIIDKEIEEYLAEKPLDLVASTDGEASIEMLSSSLSPLPLITMWSGITLIHHLLMLY